MCGICGIFSPYGLFAIDATLIQRMNSCLIHRGPDEEGVYTDSQAAIANRRLRIIDLSNGRQPIPNEDETIWIVFNGEIYNYQETRARLMRAGHHFRTNSDTETILHAYEEYGYDCLQHLAGMFAFAIWDKRCQKLFIARDRLGKKPLYYTSQNGRFLFASEIKAILQDSHIPRQLEPLALHHYLTLQYVPDPWSIYKDINKLPAAHYLICDSDGIKIDRYWDLSYLPKWQLDEQEAKEELNRLLVQSVQRRLISEVPLGAFLSGGIDSSIIVALMAQQSSQPIKTFSIGFTYQSFNELPYARQVAQHWQTDHHEFVVESERVEETLHKLSVAFDEPFADSSALQTYYLAKMTRQYVTVALSGDGGDETFAGYPRYWMDPFIHPYTILPRFITQKAFPALVNWLPEAHDVIIEANWKAGLKRLAQASRISEKASIIRWGSYFNEEMKAALYRPEFRDLVNGKDTADLLAHDYDRAQAASYLDRTLYVDTVNYLPGNGLVKVDRMTMAHSLEARQPFLDHDFVEFVARLPERWKLKGREGKALLKETFYDKLPAAIFQRPKRGFAAPIEAWLKQDLRPLVHDLLLSPDSGLRIYFQPQSVLNLIQQHEEGIADHGRRIWCLLILESWLREMK
jgi:asparagine synthase (glutamine-hydrolysing)